VGRTGVDLAISRIENKWVRLAVSGAFLLAAVVVNNLVQQPSDGASNDTEDLDSVGSSSFFKDNESPGMHMHSQLNEEASQNLRVTAKPGGAWNTVKAWWYKYVAAPMGVGLMVVSFLAYAGIITLGPVAGAVMMGASFVLGVTTLSFWLADRMIEWRDNHKAKPRRRNRRRFGIVRAALA
jgi:hypothetical protein